MREKEVFDAQQEALREGFTDLTRRASHDDVVRTYLAGIAYAARRRRRSAKPEEEPPQPVDAPAPALPRRSRRR